jgi:vacuole membrane protein 1
MGAKNEAASITLLRRPLKVVALFVLVLVDFAISVVTAVRAHLPLAFLALSLVTAWYLGKEHLPQHIIAVQERLSSELAFAAYWVILGILSSVGLGSGLHTGLLALIPFVIRVATTALRLGTTDFTAQIIGYGSWPKKMDLASLSEAISPQYADDAFTPRGDATLAAAEDLSGHPSPPGHVSFIAIASKVAWAAFLWGLGTALGELPPYFIARAAAASGKSLDELTEVDELEQEEAKKKKEKHHVGLVDRGKIFLYESVQRYGFIAVLLAASIPNPLFDLAGLTCGHFGIPFATFFGATLLGKAIFKVSIQVLFIIATVKYGAVAFEAMRAWLGVALPGWVRLHAILDSVSTSGCGYETGRSSPSCPL